MARRATVIKQERTTQVPSLVLDAGNSLTGDRPPANVTQGATTVEYMNMQGYDAMTLGPADLRLGRAALASRSEESEFPFLSANAVISETGELAAAAFITREIDGHSIAIVGLTGTWDPNPGPEFRVLDPLQAAQRTVPQIDSLADIIILLSDAGNPTDLEIAKTVPQIDLIIEGGPFQSFGSSQYIQETNTLLVHADYPAQGHTGRNLGRTVLAFDRSGNIVDHAWQLIPLGPEIPDDPEMAQWRATK